MQEFGSRTRDKNAENNHNVTIQDTHPRLCGAHFGAERDTNSATGLGLQKKAFQSSGVPKFQASNPNQRALVGG